MELSPFSFVLTDKGGFFMSIVFILGIGILLFFLLALAAVGVFLFNKK